MHSGRHRSDLDDLCRLAARHALSADETAGLAPEVVAALVRAGFPRHFVPRELGGEGGDFAGLSRRLLPLARACPSTAWCAAIHAVAARMAAYLPLSAQRLIWAEGADVPISSAFRAGGKAEPVADGWCLSGTWHYLSGIDHAPWVLLRIEPAGEPMSPRFAAVARRDFTIRDDWHTLGMRGTGSRSIVLDQVQVPAEMSFAAADLFDGRSRYAEGPQYHASPIGADPALFLSCALGAACSGLQIWLDAQPPGPLPVEQALLYARVQAQLDASRLLIRHACRLTDRGQRLAGEVVRNARDASFVAQLLLESIDSLFRQSGTRAQADSSQLQRIWRDLQTMTTHVSLRQDRNYLNYAHYRRPKAEWEGVPDSG